MEKDQRMHGIVRAAMKVNVLLLDQVTERLYIRSVLKLNSI
jgi:hypothetical protein